MTEKVRMQNLVRRRNFYMKATGIVRRIDDLGRVVIPKEIRRTLRIREGDPLEIFTDREGEIILKKYSPIGELGTLARLYAESLSQTLGCTVCITDMDQVVSASGAGKKDLQDQFITRETEKLLQERGQLLAKAGDSAYIRVTADMGAYEAAEALGASKLRCFINAIIPQVLPAYLSNCLFCFEGNVRYAAILGYVGAGGLGLIINEKVGWREYDKVGMILLVLFLTVVIIEALSHYLRTKLT